MHQTLLAVLVLTACTDPNPSRTFELRPLVSGQELPNGARGEPWQDVGIEESADAPEVTVYFQIVPNLKAKVGSYGMANRDTKSIYLDDSLHELYLDIAAAHEIGHVVLDTGSHTSCGVMGGFDIVLCDEDIALAEAQLKNY